MQITSRLTMAAHMVCAIDYFKDTQPVTSSFLAKSIGTSPVMVRTIMGMLKDPLKDITLLDLWRAVDETEADSLFHFHENPSPLCPVGRNIHAALDEDLARAQKALEDQLAAVHMDEIEGTIRKRNGLVA